MELNKNIQTALPELLKKHCLVIGNGDAAIVSNWLGVKINELSEHEYKDFIDRLVAEVCLLHGLETYDPATDESMHIAQMRSIAKFIYEGFYYLTPKEISHAFYLNLKGKFIDAENKEIFKQYGKRHLHVEFIGQVLSAYSKMKQGMINSMPELINVISPAAQIEYKAPELTEEDHANMEREYLHGQYRQFCNDPKWNYQLLAPYAYDRMVLDGFFDKKYFESNIDAATNFLKEEVNVKRNTPSSRDKKTVYDEEGNIGVIIQQNFDLDKLHQSELHKIKIGADIRINLLAKQMSILEYFKKAAKNGMQDIYINEKD